MQVYREDTHAIAVRPGGMVLLPRVYEARKELALRCAEAAVVRCRPEDWWDLFSTEIARMVFPPPVERPYGYDWQGLQWHIDPRIGLGEWTVETERKVLRTVIP